MNKKIAAQTTGYSLILMSLIAGFAFGFAYPKIYDLSNINLTKTYLIENMFLYKVLITSVFLIVIIDFIITYTLYVYFKNIDRFISLLAAALRAIYTIILGIATFSLINNQNVSSQSNDLIIYNFNRFELIWSFGLVIFGIHLFLISLLMILHNDIPQRLWILTFIGAISYFIIYILKLTLGDTQLINILDTIFTLPMALAELGLAFWLIFKGGRENYECKYKILGL